MSSNRDSNNYEFDLNSILDEASIIDNRRKIDDHAITLETVLRAVAKDSSGLKCAVGYVYLEGLLLLIDNLSKMKEIKILMGATTTPLTKNELSQIIRHDVK